MQPLCKSFRKAIGQCLCQDGLVIVMILFIVRNDLFQTYSRPVPAKDFLHFAKNYKNDLNPVD